MLIAKLSRSKKPKLPKEIKCSHRPDPSTEPCETCREERSRARRYRWRIIGGLVMPFSLQSLDLTIIASALPWIASDFGEFSQLNWIVSAFNLSSSASIPFWGQMADVFGRHATIQAATVLTLIGSALCTAAPTHAFPVLLLGRGLQGFGCAGISVVTRVILADKVSLRENAVNWSIFSFVSGISWALGPVIGGYLTNTNWRWCFGINLPVGIIGVLTIFLIIRKDLLGPQPIPELDETTETRQKTKAVVRLKTIDVGGQVLFLFGFGLIILALTWGGASYSWRSAAVLVPLVVGGLLALAFVLWEFLMSPGKTLARRWPVQRPMIPWHILADRNVGLLFYTAFTTGIAMYSVFYFCNLYFTIVKQLPASSAGVSLLYFTPGIGFGVYLSSIMINVWPRQTFPTILLGTVIEAVGVGMLAWALYVERLSVIYGMMVVVGAGAGLRILCVSIHGVGMFPENISSIISIMSVSVPFGGTLGLTIMSTVFNNVAGIGSARGNASAHQFDDLARLPPEVLDQVKHQAKMGIVWAYVAICPFMLLCVTAAGLLGNVILPKGKGSEETRRQNTIIREVYLPKLLSGWTPPAHETEKESEKNGGALDDKIARTGSTESDRGVAGTAAVDQSRG